MKVENRKSKQLPLQLLQSVLEFIAMAGVSETAARKALEKALEGTKTLRSSARGRAAAKLRSCGDVPAYLLRMWHRDARYLTDKDLIPRALPLTRGRNNLRALIKRIDPNVNALEILRTMEAVGLIRKAADGRYLPTANAALLPTLHPWAVEHASHSVMRLLSTVCRNASAGLGEPRLLERYSYVPDLDPNESREFAEFSRKQGQVLLDVLDDWLEQRRVKKVRFAGRSPARGISAGIHLITFVGDVEDKNKVANVGDKGRRQLKAPSPLPATPS